MISSHMAHWNDDPPRAGTDVEPNGVDVAAKKNIDGRFGVHLLVYFERHETMPAAIRREKQIKKWRRGWKRDLIEKTNPQWRDLYDEIVR